METEVARLHAGALTLARRALGSPDELRGKVARLGRVLVGYTRGDELDRRLAKLHDVGVIETIPTRAQLAAGSIDMLRFWISPAAAQYYAERGISYGFHQLLRFLEEPASLTDPIGFFSERDAIIGHLMQVVHANPLYDLQLLQMFDDGLDELEQQLEAMLDGTHPRAASIAAIVEEADYHARLLHHLRAWRRDPSTPPLLRSNVEGDERFRELDRTFGSLRTAMRYFVRLPETATGALAHLRATKTFPRHLAERV